MTTVRATYLINAIHGWVARGGTEAGGSVLRRKSAERGEGWGGVQVRREFANEGFHGGMPKTVEAEKIHLLQGLLGGPFFEGHAIGGDEDAGAIIAEAAVHENLFFGIIVEEGKELNHLLIRWRRPSTDRNMHETQAQGVGLPAFPGDRVRIFSAKVDHGGDAQFLEFGQALRSGLRAAIKMVIDSAGVGNARDAKFLSVSGTHDGRRNRLRMGLCGKRTRQEKGTNESEKKGIAFHFR